MRRVKGVTIEDRLRNVKILEDLHTTTLSEMIEERQLRYLGHVWRYGENRWTKFMLQAKRPGQTRSGKHLQLRKHLSRLLKKKGLTLKDAENTDVWAGKLNKMFTRGKGRKQGSEGEIEAEADDGVRVENGDERVVSGNESEG